MIERQLHIARLEPRGSVDGDADLQVVVLSDWLDRPSGELLDRIASVSGAVAADGRSPVVLVLDDVNGDGVEHRSLLNDLGGAGGIVLEPESQDEASAFRLDPMQFVSKQVAMITAPASTSSVTGPSDPTGFQQFATAVTRLPPDAMRDLIEGRRPDDDWRFES